MSEPSASAPQRPPDPFVHLPHLAGRLTPPERSALRVTADVLAAWDESARALGRPGDWRLSEAAIEATRRELLGADTGASDLWVFAYGSLMWDPALRFAEVRLAELRGWQRRFAFQTYLGRGCPEQPALMLSLLPNAGGSCQGLAFRIAAAEVEAETALLWRREMLRGSYRPQWLPVVTPQGELGGRGALVFTANPTHPDHVGDLPLADAAARIACARGMLGSNRDYVEQLAQRLQLLGLADTYIAALLEQLRAHPEAGSGRV